MKSGKSLLPLSTRIRNRRCQPSRIKPASLSMKKTPTQLLFLLAIRRKDPKVEAPPSKIKSTMLIRLRNHSNKTVPKVHKIFQLLPLLMAHQTFQLLLVFPSSPLTSFTERTVIHLHASDNNYFRAQAVALTHGVFLKRQWVIAIVVVLLVVAALVGGVCGAGLCSVKVTGQASLLVEPAPSTSPSSAPTIGSDATAVLDYINSIRLSSEPISYPVDSKLATPEEMAVQWLINEDPLELFANDTPTQTRLTQRYSLLTLWYSTNGTSWFQNQGWLTAENECTWFGISAIQTWR